MIFWDTSALVSCYVEREASHARAKNLLMLEGGHKGSELLWPEAVSAIVRRLGRNRGRRDSLLRRLESHLRAFDLVTVDSDLLGRSVRLIRAHALRAGDAIHLAAALMLSREIGIRQLRLVTADAAQAIAARGEGLRVVELPA